jgi:hypothetical protein
LFTKKTIPSHCTATTPTTRKRFWTLCRHRTARPTRPVSSRRPKSEMSTKNRPFKEIHGIDDADPSTLAKAAASVPFVAMCVAPLDCPTHRMTTLLLSSVLQDFLNRPLHHRTPTKTVVWETRGCSSTIAAAATPPCSNIHKAVPIIVVCRFQRSKGQITR